MRIERTHDMALARRLSLHPEVLPGCDDDRYDPDTFYWMGADHPCVMWLAVREGVETLGLLLFHPVAPIPSWSEDALQWEGHTMFLPGARGRTSLKAYRLALEWMWSNTKAETVTGCTPADNRPAVRMAVWAGMRRVGVRINAYHRGGKWVNGILTAIDRPAEPAEKQMNHHKEVA